ncbi:hypothetical protein LTR37_001957 [Vermiconidia calcicola]|uniref:Uncharacterized protein n=1 Tax=Vermiconidia calcicola TaxID=1690605 RepID=A0ACC3NX24_9PEZI|nr:hypothetical protein LTR37_001957 [Vermiconidia calcicola]
MALPQRLKRYLARKARSREFSSRSATSHLVTSKPQQRTTDSKGYLTYKQKTDRKGYWAYRKRRKAEKQRQRASKRIGLLELPAEMRNTIWGYALTDVLTIDISSLVNRRPPAWVSACRQMVGETWKMWYHVNQFHITIHNLNARAYHHWLRCLMSRNVARPPITVTFARSCDW